MLWFQMPTPAVRTKRPQSYQRRWVDTMAQQVHGIHGAQPHQHDDIDAANRAAFEECFRIVKAAWTEDLIEVPGQLRVLPAPLLQTLQRHAHAGVVDSRQGSQLPQVQPSLLAAQIQCQIRSPVSPSISELFPPFLLHPFHHFHDLRPPRSTHESSIARNFCRSSSLR